MWRSERRSTPRSRIHEGSQRSSMDARAFANFYGAQAGGVSALRGTAVALLTARS